MLTGRDVYGLTALLLVRGAQALVAGEARGSGVLAPAEAFDARRSPPASSRSSPSPSRPSCWQLVSSGPPPSVRPCNGSDR